MAEVHGKAGKVYTTAGASSVIEDCEDAWASGGGDAGSTASTTTGKVGTNAARFTTVAVGANAILGTETIASVDLSGYDAIVFWFRSSVTTSAGDLQLLLDDTANCASPLESLDLPALTADTWTRIVLPFATPANLTAIISLGVKQVADLADGTFDIDDVRVVAVVDGIRAWTLDYNADTVEVTDFADSGIKSYIVGGTGWSGSFDGFKDGAPLGLGASITIALAESATAGQAYIGNGYITGESINTSVDNAVTYSYTFQGTDELQVAIA